MPWLQRAKRQEIVAVVASHTCRIVCGTDPLASAATYSTCRGLATKTLRFTHSDSISLGIKLREGKTEIKQRHRDGGQVNRQYGMVRFHKRVTGVVEHWRKWSFELAGANNDLTNILFPAASWIGVNKERRLRKYRLTGDRKIVPVPAEEYPDQGCDLELTSVSVGGKEWWSLAFEAYSLVRGFGDEAALQEYLLFVARQVFAADEPPALDAGDSCSYPMWLEIVEQRDGQ